MKTFYGLIFFLFVSLTVFSQEGKVTIAPALPQIGDQVKISLTTLSDQKPELVFSYSNFFEMASILPMEKEGGQWIASFTVPRYAKYASFYIKQGNRLFKPVNGHYEIIFYKGNKPVFDTYLYKAYSLSAQYGRADSVKALVKQLTNEYYQKELELYPGNYPAKLRVLAAKMEDDKANAASYKAAAMQLIAAKLNENPTDMGNINQVTMGYLIMNEGSKNDSLKTYLLKKYPNSEVAYEYMYEDAYKTKDEEARITKMKKLLGYRTEGESSTFSGIHEHLFAYYAKHRDAPNALKSARIVAGVKNPWQAKEIKNIAVVLAENNLALDTAKMYIEKAIAMVKDYPFGVVRYFPEYGYIPGYVDNRAALIEQQKGDMLSVLGLIYTKQQKLSAADKTFKEALKLSQSMEVYKNIALYYEQAKQPMQAFNAYKNILLQLPTDSATLSNYKRNYIAYKGSEAGYEEKFAEMISEWETLNLPGLTKSRLNKPAPIFTEVYDMQGNLVNPDVLKGKLIILDFWATWCVPCIQGFPYMQQVYNRFKDNKDVVFMITNSGSKNSLKDAQEWVKKNGFTFPFYYNDRKLANAFNVTTIPSTFIIDGNGNIQYKTVGFEGPIMEPKLGLQIKSLLK